MITTNTATRPKKEMRVRMITEPRSQFITILACREGARIDWASLVKCRYFGSKCELV